jgi:hypothetical protein
MAGGGAKPGERRGGRKKGTPNKDKKALLEAIQAHVKKMHGIDEWDPVMEMAGFAADKMEAKDLRLSAAKEVAQYVRPKLKAIQHDGNIGMTIWDGADFGDG